MNVEDKQAGKGVGYQRFTCNVFSIPVVHLSFFMIVSIVEWLSSGHIPYRSMLFGVFIFVTSGLELFIFFKKKRDNNR